MRETTLLSKITKSDLFKNPARTQPWLCWYGSTVSRWDIRIGYGLENWCFEKKLSAGGVRRSVARGRAPRWRRMGRSQRHRQRLAQATVDRQGLGAAAGVGLGELVGNRGRIRVIVLPPGGEIGPCFSGMIVSSSRALLFKIQTQRLFRVHWRPSACHHSRKSRRRVCRRSMPMSGCSSCSTAHASAPSSGCPGRPGRARRPSSPATSPRAGCAPSGTGWTVAMLTRRLFSITSALP